MNEEMKYCINCGKQIPKAAEFCPFCGAKQSSTQVTNKDETPSQNSSTISTTTNSKPWFKRTSFWIIAVVVLIILGGAGFAFHVQTPQGAVNSVKSNVIAGNSDYGKATIRWDKSDRVIEINIPKNAQVMKDLNDGSVSVWNALVRDAKTESAKLNQKYSYIRIPNPSDKSRDFLEIQNGKIKYNIGDDLN